MRRKWLTEITVETREVVTLRRRGITSIWCDECGAQVRTISPEGAAAAMAMSLRGVFRQVEAGRLHPCKTREGMLFICLNSMLATICEGGWRDETHKA